MKRMIVFVVFALISLAGYSQTAIKLEDIGRHEGDSVKVCTKIFGGKYFDQSKNKLTLLNAGAAYPDNPLTLVIHEEVRQKFAEAPEVTFKNKEVCITGKLILYKGKPEIIIHDLNQISLED